MKYHLQKIDDGQSESDGYKEYYEVIDNKGKLVCTIHHNDFEWEEYENHAKIIVNALNSAVR